MSEGIESPSEFEAVGRALFCLTRLTNVTVLRPKKYLPVSDTIYHLLYLQFPNFSTRVFFKSFVCYNSSMQFVDSFASLIYRGTMHFDTTLELIKFLMQIMII